MTEITSKELQADLSENSSYLMTLIKMVSSYDSLLSAQFSQFKAKLPSPRVFKNINALSVIKDATRQLKFEISKLKLQVQIFLLRTGIQVPAELLIQEDVFYVILYSLLVQAGKSSKFESLAVYISWEPPKEN